MPERPPQLFGVPPGADFPAELVAGLLARLEGSPPEAMARMTMILNTQRMRRRVTDLLARQGSRFLPNMRLVAEIGSDMAETLPRAAISPLRRRLDLTVLLDGLLHAEPALFARTSLFNLADSLADLMDEMQGEGVSPDRISALNVADHSAHWARTQAFLGIVTTAMAGDSPDTEARQRLAVEGLVARWQVSPPDHPVILAGSTGSRGTTALLMQAIAMLPNGSVVFPGYDFDLPVAAWAAMGDALTAEDHPQFRFRRMLDLCGLEPDKMQRWTQADGPAPDRNRLISLSLRPAPITDQWLTDGPGLPDLLAATQGMSLLEAPSERSEALAIALILRHSAEAGTTAALVSPDRNLTRRVSAVLDRWGIRPDDSAGQPLALSAPGRFLRHVADLFGRKLTAEALMTLLKHPLCFSGAGRGQHLRLTRELELYTRRNGPAFPDIQSLEKWAALQGGDAASDWASRVGAAVCIWQNVSDMPLSAHVSAHRAVAERLARGFADDGAGELWEKAAGIEALAAFAELEHDADAGCDFSPADYASLFAAMLQRHEVRDAPQVHPGIMIWGTLEARVQGADLVILGGMNDGVWPPQPAPDPWLNRQMRKEAGLLLPERRIGLSAHDYQQAVCAGRVIISRPLRNADAETVPSRWLNRLTNLLDGLPMRNGPAALAAMRDRGSRWLALASVFDAPAGEPVPAHRPAPRPPVTARPKKLSLTQIERLIRDPYAIYARHVLRLYALNPLRPEADPRLRGEVLHAILEDFVRKGKTATPDRELLLSITDSTLAQRVAWPTARAIWRARIDRAADAFVAFSKAAGGDPLLIEEKGAVLMEDLGFTLHGTPDRVDRLPDGTLHLIDYKTGDPPTEAKQKAFDKQLLLAAAMAEKGGFRTLGPSPVSRITYVGIKGDLKAVETVLSSQDIADVWAGLHKLISNYARQTQGYTARRAMFETKMPGDYDHLSRFGEWDLSQNPTPEDVG